MNIAEKPGKGTKQTVFSEELPAPMPLGNQCEEITDTASNQHATAPSVKSIEAKVDRMASKPGLRSKIDANCLWCSYDPLDQGTWRQQVEACNVTRCPLHSVRPRSCGKK